MRIHPRSSVTVTVLSLFFAAAASATGPTEPTVFAPGRCEIGVYRTADDTFVAVTEASDGFRYTFSHGIVGRIGAVGSAIECGEGMIRVHGDAVRPRVAITATDTLFESHGVILAGRLLEPPGAGRHTPLVVYAHGSERTGWIGRMRDPYQMVGRGVSVFVYDKRGTGLSEGEYTQNFPRLADDLVAASEEAKRLADGRFGRFGLFGLSQGGWIAPLAARRADAEFIGIGYGLVVDIREEDAAQVSLELRRAGYGDEVIEAARTITDATARIVTSGYQDGLEALDEARERFREESWYRLIQGEYTGTLMGMSTDDLRRNGIPHYDRLEVDWTLDPVEVLRDVAVPQLWVLAAEDDEAPPALTLERLSMLRDEGEEIAVYLFPDTDHGMWEFNEGDDGSRRHTRIAPNFYDLMADWAKGELNDGYGRAVER